MNDMDGAIPLLIPDLPKTDELIPWLQQIDQNQYYSNFGPLVQQFEQAVKTEIPGISAEHHVVSCSSGTAALELMLQALALPVGSKVLVPSYTFIATGLAVLNAGYLPIFADVCDKSWSLTPSIAAKYLLEDDIAAIVPVCTYGAYQDTAAWLEFSQQTSLPIIFDAANAFAVQDIAPNVHACFSLHATKAFGIGEGGLIATTSEVLANQVRRLSSFGLSTDGLSQQPSHNYKLSEYHAAVAHARLQTWSQKKDQLMSLNAYYRRQLAPIDAVILQSLSQETISQVFPIRINDIDQRENLKSTLSAENIEYRHYYAPCLHRHPVFFPYMDEGIEPIVADHLSQSVLCIPFHLHLSDKQLNKLFRTIAKAFDI